MSDAIGAELAELAREIWAWQVDTFGDGCTVHGAVAKIRDECAEVLAVPRLPNMLPLMRKAQRREELADVFFMLVQMTGAGATLGMFTEGCRLAASLPLCDSSLPWALGGIVAACSIYYGTHMLPHTSPTGAGAALRGWLDACNANSDLPHMSAAIRAKLAENKTRRWAKPAEDGTISHVKGGE